MSNEQLFVFEDGKPGKLEESVAVLSRTACMRGGRKLYTMSMNMNSKAVSLDQETFSMRNLNKAWKACGFPGRVKRESKNETEFGRTWCYVSCTEDFEWPTSYTKEMCHESCND